MFGNREVEILFPVFYVTVLIKSWIRQTFMASLQVRPLRNNVIRLTTLAWADSSWTQPKLIEGIRCPYKTSLSKNLSRVCKLGSRSSRSALKALKETRKTAI